MVITLKRTSCTINTVSNMNKIKLTVATLLLGGMCYAQQSEKYHDLEGALASNTFNV